MSKLSDQVFTIETYDAEDRSYAHYEGEAAKALIRKLETKIGSLESTVAEIREYALKQEARLKCELKEARRIEEA